MLFLTCKYFAFCPFSFFHEFYQKENTVSVVMGGKDTLLELVEEVGHGSYVTVLRTHSVDGGT